MADFKLHDFDLFVHSDFNPPSTSHPIETFISLVKGDVEELMDIQEHLPIQHPNLTREEKVTLKALADLLTIKSADKGGGILVMDASMYRNEAVRQLSDPLVYKSDPKKDFEKKLLSIVENAYY